MKQRIGAFYSDGPHFQRMLRALREAYPDGTITAIIPPDYPAVSYTHLTLPTKRIV